MALPKHVTERRLKIEAGIAAAAPEVVDTSNPVVAEVPAAADAPITTPEVETVTTPVVEAPKTETPVTTSITEQQYATLNGRLSATDRKNRELEEALRAAQQRIDDENAIKGTYEAQLAEMRERLNAVDQKDQWKDLEDDTTDDELESYDAEQRKIAAAIAKKTLKPWLQKQHSEMEQLKAKLKEYEGIAATVPRLAEAHQQAEQKQKEAIERNFYREKLTPLVPNYEATVVTPEWREFLAATSHKNPVTGETVRNADMVKLYQSVGNVEGIAEVFQRFQGNTKPVVSLESMVVPAKVNTPARETPVVKFKLSEYEAKFREYTKNRQKPGAHEQWEKYKAPFMIAFQKGDVIDDVKKR